MKKTKKVIIDESTRVLRCSLGDGTEVRENCTFHDSIVGERCRIYERVSLKKVLIGNGVDINAGTHLEYVVVGDDVQIGPNCSIVGVYHQVFEIGVERDDTYEKVVIGKGVFVGTGSVILPGVEIGQGSVVGAGSVVTKSIPAFHIWLGVPPNQTLKSLKEWLDEGKRRVREPVRILFVCYGNAARSVMAKYFCDIFGKERIIADSAGTHPVLLEDITPELQKRLLRATLPVMEEVGIDVSGHRSKHIRETDISSFDVIVNMSPFSFIDLLRQYAPDFKGTVMEWLIPDPGDESIEAVRAARDQLREKVFSLIKEFESGR